MSDEVKQVIKEKEKKIKENKVEKINYLRSGSTLLDMVLGGNKNVFGYKSGCIFNIIGDSSSGKTFIANECLAYNFYKHKGKLKFLYDDCEQGYTFDSKNLYGFDIMTEKMPKSKTVEELFVNINNFIDSIKEDEAGIYVVDSLDSLDSKEGKKRADDRIKLAKKGKEPEKGTYAMEKQKFLSNEFFRHLCQKLEEKNCLLILISQVRANIGVMFGEKYTRSGGKALDFYAHTCLWLAVAEKIKKTVKVNGTTVERQIGVKIKAKSKKSKTPRPFRECFIDVFFDYGIDEIGSNINFLYNLNTDTGKTGNGICEWEGIEYTRKELIKYIEENNLEEELKQKVINKNEEIEDGLKSDRKKRFI